MTLSATSTTPQFGPPRYASRSPGLTYIDEEAGQQNGHTTTDAPPQRFIEELEEFKRHADFVTTDWVQDAAKEQIRQRQRRQKELLARRQRRSSLQYAGQRIRGLYATIQVWIILTLVGAAIGLNAALLNIVTKWLSDLRMGHCKTAFYLNKSFCCWGVDRLEEDCPDWQPWSDRFLGQWIAYLLFCICFAFISAFLVKCYALNAAGPGISEIKCIIAGFVMKNFLDSWTLLIKSIGMPLAIASGLSLGKEGPSVHYAVCFGNIISGLFTKYKRSAAKTREILSASAAAGVAAAFGSPIGGVLFSLEEISSSFPPKTMWRSYYCALIATAVLAAVNPFRTGQLVMFDVHYDRSWHLFELPFFVLIGILAGLYAAFLLKWNLRAQAFRRRNLTQYPICEVVTLAAGTAIICYPNAFLRIDMTELMAVLFRECEGAYDFHELCKASNRWANILSLTFAVVLRTLLAIISFGAKVPSGIFVPSMAIGASFGRIVGMILEALHAANPQSRYFAACELDVPCITPGTYAFLGAGAALSATMQITVSSTVIMFELTGALVYILPTMITIGTARLMSLFFPPGGMADRLIAFNGFPILGAEQSMPEEPVSRAMTPASDLVVLPAHGLKLSRIVKLLSKTSYSGFPIVSDQKSHTLLGYIGRTQLAHAVNRATKLRSTCEAECIFWSSNQPTKEALASADIPIVFNDTNAPDAYKLDFTSFTDITPLTVHPRLSLATTKEIFKKMGPRVMFVEHEGCFDGLITAKDCMKYEHSMSAHRCSNDPTKINQLEAWLWTRLTASASWISKQFVGVRQNRILLQTRGNGASSEIIGLLSRSSVDSMENY